MGGRGTYEFILPPPDYATTMVPRQYMSFIGAHRFTECIMNHASFFLEYMDMYWTGNNNQVIKTNV